MNLDQHKSNFFNLSIEEKNFFKSYVGWNGIILFCIKGQKNTKIDLKNNTIFNEYSEISDKEKIIILETGAVVVKLNNQNFELNNKLDVLNFYSSTTKDKIEIHFKENSKFFLISPQNSKKCFKEPKQFNFLKNIKTVDLWGGQCISRPYESENFTLVLFDLKKGFEFRDEGHANEQITWLIDGKMSFYADKEKKILNTSEGIDIGENHVHGGISDGALGFDVFYPKRDEKRYRKNI